MSHAEPRQRDLEEVLRRALRTAADSVEPGADGLERIRSRISARHSVPSGWSMAELAGSAATASSVMRNLLPVSTAARAFLHAVVARFQPDPEWIGWYRWLRPAAALATGIFVVLAGSWAITALPQVISSSASNGSPTGSGGGAPVADGSGPAVLRTGSQNPAGNPSYSSSVFYRPRHHGNFSPIASPPAASPTPPLGSAPSASPTLGSAPSASPTSTASSTPSASPTPPASCSPSPSPTPTASSPPSRSHCHGRHHHRRR